MDMSKIEVRVQALKGFLGVAQMLWGSVFARDLKGFVQEKLGIGYSDEQIATLDANYVDGLERQADAERRAGVSSGLMASRPGEAKDEPTDRT